MGQTSKKVEGKVRLQFALELSRSSHSKSLDNALRAPLKKAGGEKLAGAAPRCVLEREAQRLLTRLKPSAKAGTRSG